MRCTAKDERREKEVRKRENTEKLRGSSWTRQLNPSEGNSKRMSRPQKLSS